MWWFALCEGILRISSSRCNAGLVIYTGRLNMSSRPTVAVMFTLRFCPYILYGLRLFDIRCTNTSLWFCWWIGAKYLRFMSWLLSRPRSHWRTILIEVFWWTCYLAELRSGNNWQCLETLVSSATLIVHLLYLKKLVESCVKSLKPESHVNSI